MDDRQSTIDGLYECRECGRRVTPASYRATCPSCGGLLHDVAVSPE